MVLDWSIQSKQITMSKDLSNMVLDRTMTTSSNKDFTHLLEITLKQFDVKSPSKVLDDFIYPSLYNLMDLSRNLDLFEVYLYSSYYRARILISYFMFKAHPKIIRELSKATIPLFLRDSVSPELSELREHYFDDDF